MLKPLAFAVATLIAAAAAPAAIAGTPTGPYAIFKYCPYQTNPDAQGCVVSKISSGSFTIGNATVPITATITLQGGIQNPFFSSPFYPAVGAPTMSPTPQTVPGGLLGLVNPAPNWPGPLWNLFWNIVNTANGVTAVTEPAGPVTTNFLVALFPPDDGSDATVVNLPIRVHLQNPFLGSGCYIGSVAKPIVLKLVTNTTNPPPPNHPISGDPGTFTIQETTNPDGSILNEDGATLVDNSFAVPAAGGCGPSIPILGPLLIEPLVSGVVNLKEGLPAAAGKNTAILTGDTAIANAEYVMASEQ